ncbi:hypothetical protein SAMN04489735_1001240 [Aneurinibacillus thermoaerophilus]|uniref:Uncharacterized protein n=1 Tax=Aneurinibacillus thermoaerophilus TaxID=143495 RepID=A0A1G7WHD0_ANETH|nr:MULTISPECIES: hypothetical protein [Aneurinibacillus]MED0679031.1 hypothetical protein [Aneurinibacillus thermoaerophilus]SDG71361.1 hypothetical protein SAMN04489735_1001240 [Aneurinibacillus thermoaerophilus]
MRSTVDSEGKEVPIETGIWRIDNGVFRINTVHMENETKLEGV